MRKKFIISFLISLVFFSSIFYYLDKNYLDTKKIITDPGTNIKGEEIEVVDENELLALLVGVDAESIENKNTRTDTMILVKANFETGQVLLLSIPRDTRVIVRGKEDKINHAHAYGGMDLTLDTVRDFLGIDLNYYVKVDYKAVKEIVDAIGGVELEVSQRMKYSDPTAKPPLKIDLEPGLQVLDGQKSHDFLRFRRYRDGDVGRVKAQQYFLKQLAKELVQPKNILKIDSLIKTYYTYVDTNIPLNTLIKAGLNAKKLDVDNMETITIPGNPKMIGGLSYWIYNRDETEEIIKENFSDYLLGN